MHQRAIQPVVSQRHSSNRVGWIGVVLLLISSPARSQTDNLALLGRNTQNPAHCMDVEIVGTRAYVCNGLGAGAGIETYDITNPASMTRIDQDGPSTWRARAVGDRLFAFSHSSGVQIYDIATPATTLLGEYVPSGSYVEFEGGAVQGTTLYVAAHQNGVYALDVADPSSPTLLQVVSLGESAAWACEVTGTHLLVANGRYGLAVLDISGPPTMVGSLGLPGLANDLVLNAGGDVAFVALGPGGLASVDISDPSNPQLLNVAPTAGNLFGIGRLNDVVVGGAYTRLESFDVSDPSNLAVLGWDYTATWAMGADIEDDGNGGVVVVADWVGVAAYRPDPGAVSDIEVNPPKIDFGAVNGAEQSTVCVYNRGSASLSVTNTVAPAGFTVSPTVYTVPAGACQEVTITASGTGSVRNTIRYVSNDPDEATFRQSVYKNNAAVFPEIGSPAPDFTLPGTDGQSHTLSASLGKVVLLEFGAVW